MPAVQVTEPVQHANKGREPHHQVVRATGAGSIAMGRQSGNPTFGIILIDKQG
jgi:hypothetical protein